MIVDPGNLSVQCMITDIYIYIISIYRLVFTECNPSTCPCGDSCSNRRIQRLEWADHLRIFLTDDRGYGVQTTKTLQSGMKFLFSYVHMM